MGTLKQTYLKLQKNRIMNEVKYSEDLINMAGSAFLRDTNFCDATDKYKAKDWVCKLGKRNNYCHVYYYKGEEVTAVTPNEFILEDKRFIDFVKNKAIHLLDLGWRPIEKEVKNIVTELPNTLEYL